MNDLLQAALTYARHGWHVFPCSPPIPGDKTSGKAPIGALVPNGKDDATTSEAQIIEWWTRVPNANIGIACEPSGIVVLDVDTADGKLGAQSLREINHELTPTPTARTGSGGIHAIYARGELPPRQALGVRPGIDIIGKGYIIAAPSVHYTGGVYQWIANPPLAQCPMFLHTLQRVKSSNSTGLESTTTPHNISAELPERSAMIVAAARIADKFPAKGRHNTFFMLAGALAQSGWSAEAITEFTVMVAKLLKYETPADAEKATGSDREFQARDSVEKVARGETVMGWGTLSTVIPEADLMAARDRLGLNTSGFDLGDASSSTLPSLPGDVQTMLDATTLNDDEIIVYAESLALREWPEVISYATGIDELDALLGGGVSTQQMIAWLGKPGAGKSAFIISRLISMCGVVPQLYVTTELQHNEVLARLVSPLFGVPWRDIVRGKGRTIDGAKITREMMHEAISKACGGRVAIIGQDEIFKAGEKALELIARTMLAMKKKFGVSPVTWVDYLQELARGDDIKQIRNSVTRVAVMFRMLSQRLDAAIVAVSSVSRQAYGAAAMATRALDDPTAYLPLAKESGDVDYAAATIVFLDVADHDPKNPSPDGWRPGRIAVAKSRHGETGFAGVRFHGATGRWEAYAQGVEALSADVRAARDADRKGSELEERIVAVVKELSCYPKSQSGASALLSKSDLVAKVGGKSTQTRAALDKLLREQRLFEFSETYNESGRSAVRTIVGLAPGSEAPRVDTTPIDIRGALMGIVAPSKA